MKKSWLFLIISLALINFTSALSGYGYGGISDLLYSINPSTIILLATFIISFAILFFALNKTLNMHKKNATLPAIIAFCLALLVTYGINRSGFNFEYYLYDIGVSSQLLSTVIPLILLGGLIYLVWNFRKNSLIIVGVLLIIASLFSYEKTVLAGIGTILIIIRFFIPKGGWKMKSKRKENIRDMMDAMMGKR